MLSRAMASWPKGTLFETCFVPAGLQGDIAHATKLRRDSEYKSGILYSVVVVTPGMTLRHGSTLHPGYSLPAMFRSLWEMATAAGVALSLHPQWRRQSAASKGNRFLADHQPDSKRRRFWHSTSVSPSLHCKVSAKPTINYKRACLAASAGRAACLTNTILS